MHDTVRMDLNPFGARVATKTNDDCDVLKASTSSVSAKTARAGSCCLPPSRTRISVGVVRTPIVIIVNQRRLIRNHQITSSIFPSQVSKGLAFRASPASSPEEHLYIPHPKTDSIKHETEGGHRLKCGEAVSEILEV